MIFSTPWYRSFRQRLIDWYSTNHRQLPWRDTNNPYHIWVSEIMLQQTQVATVIDYYHRFLKRFPTVESLARAPQEDVLEHWSGLGYYRRARSLHAAAQQIVESLGGEFPNSVETIQELHGIGRYTAGAIASFAFDQPAPILEANTIRLFSRIMAITESTQLSSVQNQLWQFAAEILPTGNGSGKLNQAVMELGSLICTPQNPKCQSCPIRKQCRAHELGLEGQIPLVLKKPKAEPLVHVGAVIQDRQGRFLLRQNDSSQWWQDLWDLPWVEIAVRKSLKLDASERHEIEQTFSERLGIRVQVEQQLASVRHAVTKYKVHYFCLRSSLAKGSKLKASKNLGWFSSQELPPVSSRFKKIRLES